MKPLVRKSRSRTIPAILLGIVLCLVVVPLAAGAAPTGTDLKVYKSPCRGGTCDSDDTPLTAGAQVRGAIVVNVTSRSSVGLTWLELEADAPDGTTVCLRRWQASSAKSFTKDLTWATERWPSASQADGCTSSGSYGDITRNGAYTLRVIVHEDVTDDEATDVASIRLDNLPETPQWSGDPSVAGEPSAPVVHLQWAANPEPDVEAYDVIRRDPGGERRTVRVNAADPGRQGCGRSGSVYQCQDASFPSAGWSGTYTYSLIAYRNGADGSPLASDESSGRSVTLTEPPPPPPSPTPEESGSQSSSPSASPDGSPTGSPSGSPAGSPSAKASVLAERTSRPDSREFFTGTFEKTLPYSSPNAFSPNRVGVLPSQTVIAAAEEGMPDDTSPVQVLAPVAGGLLLLLGAAHIIRVLTGR